MLQAVWVVIQTTLREAARHSDDFSMSEQKPHETMISVHSTVRSANRAAIRRAKYCDDFPGPDSGNRLASGYSEVMHNYDGGVEIILDLENFIQGYSDIADVTIKVKKMTVLGPDLARGDPDSDIEPLDDDAVPEDEEDEPLQDENDVVYVSDSEGEDADPSTLDGPRGTKRHHIAEEEDAISDSSGIEYISSTTALPNPPKRHHVGGNETEIVSGEEDDGDEEGEDDEDEGGDDQDDELSENGHASDEQDDDGEDGASQQTADEEDGDGDGDGGSEVDDDDQEGEESEADGTDAAQAEHAAD